MRESEKVSKNMVGSEYFCLLGGQTLCHMSTYDPIPHAHLRSLERKYNCIMLVPVLAERCWWSLAYVGVEGWGYDPPEDKTIRPKAFFLRFFRRGKILSNNFDPPHIYLYLTPYLHFFWKRPPPREILLAYLWYLHKKIIALCEQTWIFPPQFDPWPANVKLKKKKEMLVLIFATIK